MRMRRLIAIAAVLSAGVSAPALAAWDTLGSVDFSFRNDRETQYGNFGGSIERLSLRAENSDVICRDVRATFGNGVTREIFHGDLPRGQDVVVDLPGESRMVRRLDFTCHALDPRGSTVAIAADIGRYRDEWRGSPDWDRFWSQRFSWADFGGNRGWMPLGSERFAGRFDHGTVFAGPRGRDVEAVGLRPLDTDARCTRVVATFYNGRRVPLNVPPIRLQEDRMFRVDLPGQSRNLERLDMDCHAERGRGVTIQVLASR